MLGPILTVVAVGSVLGGRVPTDAQLEYSKFELGAQISYDLITQLTSVPNPQHFCIGAGGDHAFAVPPATAFNPTSLNATQWVESLAAQGTKFATYVAMHCSGFSQWPSKVNNYSIAQSNLPAGTNPLYDFMAACKKFGVAPGIYATYNYNYLYNVGMPGGKVQPGPLAPGQINVTDDEYHKFAVSVLEEIYSLPYVRGQLAEVWFDGGENDPEVNAIIQKYQPQAVYSQGRSPNGNNIRIGGYESGFLPYPSWSYATLGQENVPGSPDGPDFLPIEGDTTYATKDGWFWKPNQQYRPLAQLQMSYVNTVGRNGNLQIGAIPDNTGMIPKDQLSLMDSLGDWIKRCYGNGTALVTWNGPPSDTVEIDIPAAQQNVPIDRVVLMEDQTSGARVMNYTAWVMPPDSGWHKAYVQAGTGQAVGNKRIHFLSTGPMFAQSIKVTVEGKIPGSQGPVAWRQVEVRQTCD